jgi:3-oxoadipate enol-lactonase
LGAIVGWSVTDQMPNIQLLTLIIAANQDCTPVSDKEAYVAKMKQAKLVVIPDSRHATPVESPTQFNEELMAFYSKK